MKKKKKRYPNWGSTFAPMFPQRMGTPRTSHDTPPSPVGAPPSPGPAEGVATHKIKSVVSEMRAVLSEYGGSSGTSAPSAVMAGASPGVVTPSGPGFSPASSGARAGSIDYKRSPGLSFRTENGLRLWNMALEIMPRSPNMTVALVIQMAMRRAGVGYGKIDATEMRMLEMGIQAYLSDSDNINDSNSPLDIDGDPARVVVADKKGTDVGSS
jgi:hypothetical protein